MKIFKKKNINKIRLSIFKSNKHIYTQVIDDNKAITLFSNSTIQKEIKKLFLSKQEKAYLVGYNIGLKLLNLKISNIYFDKGTKTYCGLISILADGIRKTGLKF